MPLCRNTKSDELKKDLAQVHGRYIAGLREVNHCVQQRASPAKSPHQAFVYLSLARCHALSSAPNAAVAPPCTYASSGNYGLYLPLGRVTVAHVAPCLLGYRGTAR